MARLLLAVVAALMLAASASAATIEDLRALGYTVTVSNSGPAGQNCPTYYVSGHGVSTYVNCNTPQADIDSLANPTAICNADWQINHPDQFDALRRLLDNGWSISGDQCADSYTVTNPKTEAAVYSGSGAGLPALASQIGKPEAAPLDPAQPPSTNDSPQPAAGGCLPLCSNPGETRGADGTVSPAPAPTIVVATSSPAVTYVYDPQTGTLADTRLLVAAGDAVAV